MYINISLTPHQFLLPPSPSALEPEFYQQLVRECEGEMEGGVRELGSGVSTSSSERALHIIRILTAATDMMVWASRDNAGEGWSLLPWCCFI